MLAFVLASFVESVVSIGSSLPQVHPSAMLGMIGILGNTEAVYARTLQGLCGDRWSAT